MCFLQFSQEDGIWLHGTAQVKVQMQWQFHVIGKLFSGWISSTKCWLFHHKPSSNPCKFSCSFFPNLWTPRKWLRERRGEGEEGQEKTTNIKTIRLGSSMEQQHCSQRSSLWLVFQFLHFCVHCVPDSPFSVLYHSEMSLRGAWMTHSWWKSCWGSVEIEWLLKINLLMMLHTTAPPQQKIPQLGRPYT